MVLVLLLMRALLFPVPLLLCGVQHLPARCRAAELPAGLAGPGLPAQRVDATVQGPMQPRADLGGQQADVQVCCCARVRGTAPAGEHRVELVNSVSDVALR
jgi:hypothetical protein